MDYVKARDLEFETGCSRQITREAIAVLIGQGLLAPTKSFGLQIVRTNGEQVRHLVEHRVELETRIAMMIRKEPAYRAEANARLSALLNDLKAICQELRPDAQLDEETNQKVWRLDTAYHAGMCHIAGCSVFVPIVLNLMDRIHLAVIPPYRVRKELETMIFEHRKILDAMVSESSSKAEVQKLLYRSIAHLWDRQ